MGITIDETRTTLARTKEQRIGEIALRLFLLHGYRKVTMSDIAAAVGVSRPTLYGVYPNKEAIFGALLDRETERHEHETRRRLASLHVFQDRLVCVFDVWIVEPFASVIDSANGIDLMTNCKAYVPEQVAALYARFEAILAETLRPELGSFPAIDPDDLAHILMLAVTGMKVSTETLSELRRMVSGLTILVDAVRAPR